jgi:hypothetical protein
MNAMATRLATAEAAIVAKIKPGRASTSWASRIVSSGEAVKRDRDTSSNQKMVPTLHVKTRQVMNLISGRLMRKVRRATAYESSTR